LHFLCYAGCHFAEYHHTEYCFAKCHYSECHYAECRGAQMVRFQRLLNHFYYPKILHTTNALAFFDPP
jgi:hypothetical protein